MAFPQDTVSMALFCDFENVALGVRDTKHEKFDIRPVLERLLLKGSIVVKKAYCDWERYKGFKATMHEANFELIEIPHVRQSGKNSADIRLVVDALDLCYTKAHVNTFVIISGDSDFSPLVSKLRENAKQVIGVGVRQSTSDLLIANCDEFIFYDDLMRESQRAANRRQPQEAQPPAPRRTPDEERRRREEQDNRRTQAIDMAVQTFDALVSERGDSGKIWASVLKEAIKRRKPDFHESNYGFRTFGNLLEEAQARGMLQFGRDDKSGAYVFRGAGVNRPAEPPVEPGHTTDALQDADLQATHAAPTPEPAMEPHGSRRRGRGGRQGGHEAGQDEADAMPPRPSIFERAYGPKPAPLPEPAPEVAPQAAPEPVREAVQEAAPAPAEQAAREPLARPVQQAAPEPLPVPEPRPDTQATAEAQPVAEPAPRSRRPRKTPAKAATKTAAKAAPKAPKGDAAS